MSAATRRPATRHAESFEVLNASGGAEVHLLRTARFKSVLALWVFEAPLDGERAARALLADLLTRGTARTPDLSAMAARCQDLFDTELVSSVTAHGPMQVLRFGFETIADRFAGGRSLFREATELLAEVLHDPPLVDGRFRRDHFEQERSNLVRAIQGLTDDKGLLAYRRLTEAMHAGTPFARHSWGSEAEARALTEEQLRATWQDLVTSAPARLFVVGDVAPDEALATAERLGGGTSRRTPSAPSPPPVRTRSEVLRLRERQDLAQTKLAMGFRLPPERLTGPSASLMATVLGGGSHARLFKRVRERESLAYGCGASALPDSGTLVVQAGVDGSAASRVQELVLEELELLGREGVSEAELELSRRAQRRRLRNLRDAGPELVAFRLFGLMTGRTHELDPALDALDGVDAQAVVAVAAETGLDTVFLLEGDAP